MLSANGYLSIFIAVPLNSLFMSFMFSKFIYYQGCRFMRREGINLEDLLESDTQDPSKLRSKSLKSRKQNSFPIQKDLDLLGRKSMSRPLQNGDYFLLEEEDVVIVSKKKNWSVLNWIYTGDYREVVKTYIINCTTRFTIGLILVLLYCLATPFLLIIYELELELNH